MYFEFDYNDAYATDDAHTFGLADFHAEVSQDAEDRLRDQLSEYQDFEDAVSDLQGEWHDLDAFAGVIADFFDVSTEQVWHEIDSIHRVAGEHRAEQLADRRMNQADNLTASY